jgi:hypothetical protein
LLPIQINYAEEVYAALDCCGCNCCSYGDIRIDRKLFYSEEIMRWSIVLALVLVFTIFAIHGCGPDIMSGRITEKKYVPAHWEEQDTYEYNFSTGEYEWGTEDVWVPDKWKINICNYTADKEFVCKDVLLSPAQFSAVKVGDWYSPKVEEE